jgi:hypothetical protein
MGLFNQSFTNIASQFGMPLFGVAGAPPFTGNYFWVDENSGSDGNTGGPQDPLKTLKQAHANCLAGNNDVVFLTGTCHTAATIAWTKNNTHLIGLSAPSDNDRSRISQTGSSVFTPLVNVTAAGCIFKNLGTFHGFDDASTQICWAEGGGRNYYESVQFLGMGNATAAAQAGSRSITIGGSGENLFNGCTFGLDTVLRATNANATMEIIGGSPRNALRGSIFQALVSDASDLHILIAANGMDRYLFLDDCFLFNAVDSTGTAMSAAISNAGGSPAGSVVLNNCISLGATAIATTGAVYVNQISAAGATTTGIALHAT